MAKYPIFIELGGRRVVVIGGGSVAVRKVQALLSAEARVVVVAKHIGDMMAALCTGTDVELVESGYSKSYLTNAVLVIAATNNNNLNKKIYKDCQELDILCNVVDVPELCDFFVPAVVRRGALQIAVSTDGYSPAYAGHLRKKLESVITEEHGHFLDQLNALRKRVIDQVAAPADRKTVFGRLVDDTSFEYFEKNGPAAWRDHAEKIILEHKS
ncbi:MAG: bifunctional precorrin-2 dehydrogenase/sirohydrochlorin ferrochelatase [Sedimentisphaerales bacterium]|nr:bifunctional precorrin-2 dehydrogenase/sirohydrochlorin ferrochelatase [Sedimentisphaerales bacterium]